MTSKLKALRGCSSHHLQGAGAYCAVCTTGCPACTAVVLTQTYCQTVVDWVLESVGHSTFACSHICWWEISNVQCWYRSNGSCYTSGIEYWRLFFLEGI